MTTFKQKCQEIFELDEKRLSGKWKAQTVVKPYGVVSLEHNPLKDYVCESNSTKSLEYIAAMPTAVSLLREALAEIERLKK